MYSIKHPQCQLCPAVRAEAGIHLFFASAIFEEALARHDINEFFWNDDYLANGVILKVFFYFGIR